MSLPNIEHATVTKKSSGATEIRMDEGWVFYDIEDYNNLTDEEGNPFFPPPEELCYYRFICFAPSVTAEAIEARIIVVAEADVPAE